MYLFLRRQTQGVMVQEPSLKFFGQCFISGCYIGFGAQLAVAISAAMPGITEEKIAKSLVIFGRGFVDPWWVGLFVFRMHPKQIVTSKSKKHHQQRPRRRRREGDGDGDDDDDDNNNQTNKQRVQYPRTVQLQTLQTKTDPGESRVEEVDLRLFVPGELGAHHAHGRGPLHRSCLRLSRRLLGEEGLPPGGGGG